MIAWLLCGVLLSSFGLAFADPEELELENEQQGFALEPRFLQDRNDLEYLNGFFASMRFGPAVGPCPESAGGCLVDNYSIDKLYAAIVIPLKVKNLGAEYSATNNVACYVTSNVAPYCSSPGVAASLKDNGWLDGGTTKLSETFLNNLQLSSVDLTSSSRDPQGIMPFQFAMGDFSMDLSTRYLLKDAALGATTWEHTNARFSWLKLPNINQGRTTFQQAGEKRVVKQNGSFRFSSLLNLVPEYCSEQDFNAASCSNGKKFVSLDEDLPRYITLSRSSERCRIQVPRLLVSDFPEGTGLQKEIDLLLFTIAFPLDFVIPLFSGVLATVICSFYEGLFWIRDGGDSKNLFDRQAWTPGVINVFLGEQYKKIHQYIKPLSAPGSQQQQAGIKLAEEKQIAIAANNAARSVKFAQEPRYSTVYDGINGILGEQCSRQGCSGLVLNDFIDRVLDNQRGELVASDPYRPVPGVEFPLGTFSSSLLSGPLNVTFSVLSYTITGLNTFTKPFRVVAVPFDNTALTSYTLENTLKLNRLSVKPRIRMTVSSGPWVAANKKTQDFDFTAELKMTDGAISSYVTAFANLTNLYGIRLGSFLDNANYDDQLNCALKVLFGAQIASLRLSGTFEAPTFSDFSNGLSKLIGETTALFTESLKGLLNTHLPSLAENLLKPELNRFADAYFSSSRPCKVYAPKAGVAYLNLEGEVAVQAVDRILNRAVGGNPVKSSEFDINSLVDFYAERSLGDIGDALGVKILRASRGAYEIMPQNQSFDRDLLTLFSLDTLSYVSLRKVSVTDVDSVSQLTFRAASREQLEARGRIGSGSIVDERNAARQVKPVKLQFSLSGDVCKGSKKRADGSCQQPLLAANDATQVTVEFTFSLDALATLQLDENKLYALDFENAFYPMCILATLDDYKFAKFDLNTTRIVTSVSPLVNGGWSTTRIGKALTALQQELNSDETQKITTNQVRYVIQRFAAYLKDVVVDSRKANQIPLTGNACRSYEYKIISDVFKLGLPTLPLGCGFIKSPSEGTGLFRDQPLVKFWPWDRNFTLDAKNAKYIADPASWEQDESIVIPVDADGNARDAVDIRKVPLVQSLRNAFNSNGTEYVLQKLTNETFFSNYLKLRDDEVTVDFEADFTDSGPILENDFFIQGLKISFGKFKLNNIGKAEFAFFKEYERDAAFTTAHDIKLPFRATASLELFIETNPAFVGLPAGGAPVREKFTLIFEVDSLRIDAVTFLVADKRYLFNELTLSTWLDVDPVTQEIKLREEFVDCILKVPFLGGVGIPGFQATYDELVAFKLEAASGDFSQSKLITKAGAELLGASLDMFADMFRQEFPDISQGCIREYLDAELKRLAAESRNFVRCPDRPMPDFEGGAGKFFKFTSENKQLMSLYSLVETSLLDPESPVNVNAFLNVLTSIDLFGIQTTTIPLKYGDEGLGDFSAAIKNVYVKNLGTVDSIKLFDFRPVVELYEDDEKGYVTRSFVGLGADPAPPAKPLNVELEFEVSLTVDELFIPRDDMLPGASGKNTKVSDEVKVVISFERIDVGFDLLTKISLPDLLMAPLASFLDIAAYPCLLSIFDERGLQVKEYKLELGAVKISLECVGSCNSPQLQFLEDGKPRDDPEFNKKVDKFVKDGVALFNTFIKSPEFEQDIYDAIDTSLPNCLRETGGNGPDTGIGGKQNVAGVLGVVGLSAFFVSCISMSFLYPKHLRRRDQVLKLALINAASSGESSEAKAKFILQERLLASMAAHPAVPGAARVLVPLVCAVNMIFFLTAALKAEGAAVDVTFKVLGDETFPLTLMSFTLESSINDMFDSGAIFLALLIAFLSGGWPYAKNLALLFCWFAPSTILGSGRKGTTLEVLDALGKWALIDIYVLIMLCVAFRFFVSSSYLQGTFTFLPDNAFVVDVFVNPKWGIYGFLTGAVGSLLVNHVMIHFHRTIKRSDQDLQDKVDGTFVQEARTPSEAISKYRFKATDEKGRVYGFSAATRLFLPVLTVLSIVLVVLGAFVPLMTFYFNGVTGTVLSLADAALAKKTYSLVDIAAVLVDGAPAGASERLGIFLLQLVYVSFAFVVPVALLVLFLFLWYKPLSLAGQRKLLFVAEILSAWEALLVFVISAVATVLQISTVAQFIVRKTTGSLCGRLVDGLLQAGISEADAQCFDVTAELEASSVSLIVGSILLTIVTLVMNCAMHAVVQDRENEVLHKESRCPAGKSPGVHVGHWLLRMLTTPVARVRVNEHAEQVAVSRGDPGAARKRASDNPLFNAKVDIDV